MKYCNLKRGLNWSHWTLEEFKCHLFEIFIQLDRDCYNHCCRSNSSSQCKSVVFSRTGKSRNKQVELQPDLKLLLTYLQASMHLKMQKSWLINLQHLPILKSYQSSSRCRLSSYKDKLHLDQLIIWQKCCYLKANAELLKYLWC